LIVTQAIWYLVNALLHPMVAWPPRGSRRLVADALAASRAPTLPSILVYVDCDWNLLRLIMTLRWVLEARKGFFIVVDALAVLEAPIAGAASAAWSATSSALYHLGPDGRAGEAPPRARRVVLLAVQLAGCWLRPLARTLAMELALRTSFGQVDDDSTLRAGMRSSACPPPSTTGALLKGHRIPPAAWMGAVRLSAHSAKGLPWFTASAQASSQNGRLERMRRRRRTKIGKEAWRPEEQTIERRPGGRRSCIREPAEVGVATSVLVTTSARTSTSVEVDLLMCDGMGVPEVVLLSSFARTSMLAAAMGATAENGSIGVADR
jgi:hypothetical protein